MKINQNEKRLNHLRIKMTIKLESFMRRIERIVYTIFSRILQIYYIYIYILKNSKFLILYYLDRTYYSNNYVS